MGFEVAAEVVGEELFADAAADVAIEEVGSAALTDGAVDAAGSSIADGIGEAAIGGFSESGFGSAFYPDGFFVDYGAADIGADYTGSAFGGDIVSTAGGSVSEVDAVDISASAVESAPVDTSAADAVDISASSGPSDFISPEDAVDISASDAPPSLLDHFYSGLSPNTVKDIASAGKTVKNLGDLLGGNSKPSGVPIKTPVPVKSQFDNPFYNRTDLEQMANAPEIAKQAVAPTVPQNKAASKSALLPPTIAGFKTSHVIIAVLIAGAVYYVAKHGGAEAVAAAA